MLIGSSSKGNLRWSVAQTTGLSSSLWDQWNGIWYGRNILIFVFGNLLVLIPWQPSFNANSARIERLDLCIRIPFRPTEYMSSEMIKGIIRFNKIGKFIKLDSFSELQNGAKFTRVCVNVKNKSTLKGYMEVSDCYQVMRDYNVWYKGILEGCRHW